MKSCGNMKNDEHGITVEVAVAGQHGNSTVAESVGAIVAVCAYRPANVGIDNAACVQAACQLEDLALALPCGTNLESPVARAHHKTHCTGKRRRPWTLQPNGHNWLTLLK